VIKHHHLQVPNMFYHLPCFAVTYLLQLPSTIHLDAELTSSLTKYTNPPIGVCLMSASAASLAHLTRMNRRLARFREDHRNGFVSAELVRQYEVLVSYAERDVQNEHDSLR